MKPKPSTPRPKEEPASEPGHLGVDDRGSVTWQWAEDEALQADDTFGATTRLTALIDPRLQLSDDDGSANSSEPNPKRLKSGYDPYDSGALGKVGRKKKKNLRELSKWIELRRKMGRTDGK